jgi:AraC-like DNA-binding protein
VSAHFAVHRPPPALAPWVAGIWFARGLADSPREVVLPNGYVELIVSLGAPQSALGRTFRGAFVAGTQRGPLLISDEGGADLVGIRFRPGGLFPWLRAPLCELTDRVEEAHDTGLGWMERELRERLGDAPDDDAARLAIVTRELLGRAHDLAPDPRIARAVGQVRSAHADQSITGLARALGVSHKHLDGLFKARVGVSPRKLARVLRFHSVVTRLQHGPPRPWATLAAEHGFADQAHLAREFRTFAGVTPGVFLRSRTPDGWHLRAR